MQLPCLRQHGNQVTGNLASGFSLCQRIRISSRLRREGESICARLKVEEVARRTHISIKSFRILNVNPVDVMMNEAYTLFITSHRTLA